MKNPETHAALGQTNTLKVQDTKTIGQHWYQLVSQCCIPSGQTTRVSPFTDMWNVFLRGCAYSYLRTPCTKSKQLG
jgi:hypothetical protein